MLYSKTKLEKKINDALLFLPVTTVPFTYAEVLNQLQFVLIILLIKVDA